MCALYLLSFIILIVFSPHVIFLPFFVAAAVRFYSFSRYANLIQIHMNGTYEQTTHHSIPQNMKPLYVEKEKKDTLFTSIEKESDID